jgi:hypothetical protein
MADQSDSPEESGSELPLLAGVVALVCVAVLAIAALA